jgi:catechol 2,3-dioxygenase-like lactoylglutathione lyase family enzyme
MAVTHINVVSVPVSDQDRALEFYRDALGFAVVSDNPFPDPHTGNALRWVQLALAGAQTHISLVTWFSTMPAGSQQGMVLEVDDLEATIASMKAKGVEITEIETAPWGSWVNVKDPDGNGLVIQKSTPMSM